MSATRGAACGLVAAALFGASAPAAKLLVAEVPPVLLSALLYLGAGLALGAYRIARRGRSAEAKLGRADLPRLAGITVLGGAVAPLLMLLGIARVSASSGALLLNLEAPLTIGLAVLVFGEHLARREALAAALVCAGALVLGAGPGTGQSTWIGALAIAAACLAWAIDNNLCQRLSDKDPVALVCVKALSAGGGMLLVALATGGAWPRPALLGAALGVGALGYGLSLLLDIYALRLLGAAREAAFFATAPFLGAALAGPLTGAWPQPRELAGGAVMVLGVVLLVRARHGHVHRHDAIEHDHVHVHDAHHQHPHEGPVTEPHAHPHRHAPLVHDHPHVSDAHHRHRH